MMFFIHNKNTHKKIYIFTRKNIQDVISSKKKSRCYLLNKLREVIMSIIVLKYYYFSSSEILMN